MSHSKIILVTILTFWSSSSLIGMEWFSWKKKYNPEDHNFLSENIYKLMLFNNAHVEDRDGKLVPADIKRVIVQDGCDIYCYQLFESKIDSPFYGKIKFKDFWQSELDTINNEIRIKEFQGKKIEINDFNFITMNSNGREILYRIFLTIPRSKDGKFQYCYPMNVITKTQLDHPYKQVHLINPLSPEEYNKALKMRLELRSKVGNCDLKAIGKEIVSSDAKWTGVKTWGILGGMTGAIGGGILSGDYEALHAFALALEAGSSNSSLGRHLAEQEMKRIKYSPEGVKSIFLGGCAGAAVGAFVGLITARDDDRNKVFSVEKKPLLTLKEQEIIKKEKKEAQEKKAREKEFETFSKMSLKQKLTNSTPLAHINLRNRE